MDTVWQASSLQRSVSGLQIPGMEGIEAGRGRPVFDTLWRVRARGGQWMTGFGTPAVATNQRHTL